MERAGLMARPTSFYYAFLVLPADQRHAIMTVWDFCRAVDDAVDEMPTDGASRSSGHAAVELWRRELAACYDGTTPSTPQGRALQPVVAPFGLPRQAFEDVIDGVEMDLERSQYRTFDDLRQYCRRVASAVGIICIRIFGCTNPRAAEYAENLGIALQLTNILRDVRADLEKDRVYLPLEDLDTYGCSIEDLRRETMTEPMKQLIAFECDRARTFYARAVDARPPEDRKRLLAAEIMRAVYFETLRRIERGGYDVFAATRVPRPRQAMIALGQWLWPA
jgi:15-cis-phytoene synthase